VYPAIAAAITIPTTNPPRSPRAPRTSSTPTATASTPITPSFDGRAPPAATTISNASTGASPRATG
jgi:hypothetical protein